MKTTQFSDPVVYTKGQNTVPSDLTAGIDTKGNAYVAWIRYSPVVITTTADADRARRLQFEASATVPFVIGQALCRTALEAFFNLFAEAIKLDGVSAPDLSGNEAITRIKAEIASMVVLVDAPASAIEPDLTDEDYVKTVLN